MAKKPIEHNCFHGSSKYTNGSHGYPSAFMCVFIFPLKCDTLEETPKKAAFYANYEKVRRL